MTQTTKLELSSEQVEALRNLLETLLRYVNFGAGVDAFLGGGDNEDDPLLLDPDDEANGHLCDILGLIKGDPAIDVARMAGARLRETMTKVVVPGLLENAGFTNVKVIVTEPVSLIRATPGTVSHGTMRS